MEDGARWREGSRTTAGEGVTLDIPFNRAGEDPLAQFHRLPTTFTITFAGTRSHRTFVFRQHEHGRGHGH
jgi:hypothetical protein